MWRPNRRGRCLQKSHWWIPPGQSGWLTAILRREQSILGVAVKSHGQPPPEQPDAVTVPVQLTKLEVTLTGKVPLPGKVTVIGLPATGWALFTVQRTFTTSPWRNKPYWQFPSEVTCTVPQAKLQVNVPWPNRKLTKNINRNRLKKNLIWAVLRCCGAAVLYS